MVKIHDVYRALLLLAGLAAILLVLVFRIGPGEKAAPANPADPPGSERRSAARTAPPRSSATREVDSSRRASQGGDAAPGTIRVASARSLAPLVGRAFRARAATGERELHVVTDEAGAVELPEGVWDLEPEANDGVLRPSSFEIAGGGTHGATFVPTTTIPVRVEDASGRPVPDARVTCRPGDDGGSTLEASTDAAGHARFDRVPRGPFSLTATHPRHGAAFGEFAAVPRDGARLTLESRGARHLRITDTAGVALPGARVRVPGRTDVSADERGRATLFPDLLDGAPYLDVEAPSHATQRVSVSWLGTEDPVQVALHGICELRLDVEVDGREAADWTARIVAAAGFGTGSPEDGPPRPWVADGVASARSPSLALPRNVSVEVAVMAGDRSEVVTLDVPGVARGRQRVSLNAAAVLVRVVDCEGSPVGAAWMEVTTPDGGTVHRFEADGAGAVALPASLEGSRAVVGADGYTAVEVASSDLNETEAPEVRLLATPARAAFRVLDPDGVPIAGADVVARPPEGSKHGCEASGRPREVHLETDAAGLTRAVPLMPGEHRVALLLGPHTEETERVSVEIGVDSEVVDLVFPRPRPLTLRFTDRESGAPVSGRIRIVDGKQRRGLSMQGGAWSGWVVSESVTVEAIAESYRPLVREIDVRSRALFDLELEPIEDVTLFVLEGVDEERAADLTLVGVVGQELKSSTGAPIGNMEVLTLEASYDPERGGFPLAIPRRSDFSVLLRLRESPLRLYPTVVRAAELSDRFVLSAVP